MPEAPKPTPRQELASAIFSLMLAQPPGLQFGLHALRDMLVSVRRSTLAPAGQKKSGWVKLAVDNLVLDALAGEEEDEPVTAILLLVPANVREAAEELLEQQKSPIIRPGELN